METVHAFNSTRDANENQTPAYTRPVNTSPVNENFPNIQLNLSSKMALTTSEHCDAWKVIKVVSLFTLGRRILPSFSSSIIAPFALSAMLKSPAFQKSVPRARPS
jgi:hypothetical protein